jgi:hypothetical protein
MWSLQFKARCEVKSIEKDDEFDVTVNGKVLVSVSEKGSFWSLTSFFLAFMNSAAGKCTKICYEFWDWFGNPIPNPKKSEKLGSQPNPHPRNPVFCLGCSVEPHSHCSFHWHEQGWAQRGTIGDGVPLVIFFAGTRPTSFFFIFFQVGRFALTVPLVICFTEKKR